MNPASLYGTHMITQHRDGIRKRRRPQSQNHRIPKERHPCFRTVDLEYLRANRKGIGRVAQIEHLPSRHQGNYILSEPANIFIALGGVVKLGDMNVSKITERGFCMTQTGTPYYASPEVWKDEPYD
jgi:serine/threonine protein kinase